MFFVLMPSFNLIQGMQVDCKIKRPHPPPLLRPPCFFVCETFSFSFSCKRSFYQGPFLFCLIISLAYNLSCHLAYRAATKLLHPCLSLASLWMVPQLWFMFFIFASTILFQFVVRLTLIIRVVFKEGFPLYWTGVL